MSDAIRMLPNRRRYDKCVDWLVADDKITGLKRNALMCMAGRALPANDMIAMDRRDLCKMLIISPKTLPKHIERLEHDRLITVLQSYIVGTNIKGPRHYVMMWRAWDRMEAPLLVLDSSGNGISANSSVTHFVPPAEMAKVAQTTEAIIVALRMQKSIGFRVAESIMGTRSCSPREHGHVPLGNQHRVVSLVKKVKEVDDDAIASSEPDEPTSWKARQGSGLGDEGSQEVQNRLASNHQEIDATASDKNGHEFDDVFSDAAKQPTVAARSTPKPPKSRAEAVPTFLPERATRNEVMSTPRARQAGSLVAPVMFVAEAGRKPRPASAAIAASTLPADQAPAVSGRKPKAPARPWQVVFDCPHWKAFAATYPPERIRIETGRAAKAFGELSEDQRAKCVAGVSGMMAALRDVNRRQKDAAFHKQPPTPRDFIANCDWMFHQPVAAAPPTPKKLAVAVAASVEVEMRDFAEGTPEFARELARWIEIDPTHAQSVRKRGFVRLRVPVASK